MQTYICVYIYIHTILYMYVSLSIYLSLYTYIYIYIHIYMHSRVYVGRKARPLTAGAAARKGLPSGTPSFSLARFR